MVHRLLFKLTSKLDSVSVLVKADEDSHYIWFDFLPSNKCCHLIHFNDV